MSFTNLADQKMVEKTKKGLENKGYEVIETKNGKEALEHIKNLVPKGKSVMNGASTTLNQIGFTEYLKSDKHDWNNLHSKIVAETDPEKQSKLRKDALSSDYYFGSVHALTQDGRFIIASNTGSQLPHIVFSSPNLIFVVSTKKIVENIDKGMERLEKHVIPLEDQRMQKAYGVSTNPSKVLLFNAEPAMLGRKITFILVGEDLGF